ncbi:alpha-aminoadipate/glutamate carrier protein LysW [Phycisphaerales bacterium]|nr:alpha-aminoadipate/glutamate carrier protein LysW [Phycisphaerales bacterium]
MSATPTASHQCECPECAGSVNFARAPLNGEVVRCGDCGVELEVTNTAPITVTLAPEVEEDWGE